MSLFAVMSIIAISAVNIQASAANEVKYIEISEKAMLTPQRIKLLVSETPVGYTFKPTIIRYRRLITTLIRTAQPIPLSPNFGISSIHKETEDTICNTGAMIKCTVFF